MLVDTGAALSCIPNSTLAKLGLSVKDLKPSYAQNVVDAGGREHASIGSINLPIHFGQTQIMQKVQVYPGFSQPVILGMDFFENTGAVFDAKNKTLYIEDPQSKSLVSNRTDTGLARVVKDTIIPAHGVLQVEVAISKLDSENKRTVLLEPLPFLPDNHLAGAKCLVSVLNGRSYMEVLNPGAKDITLLAQSLIASASIIDQNSIMSMSQSSTKVQSAPKQEPIEFNFSDSDLSDEEKVTFQNFLNKYRSVFAVGMSELGATDLVKHRIETGDAPPIRQQFFRQSVEVREAQDKMVEEMLEHDIIEESNSMWSSPVVMVKKRDSSYRFAIDYRKLNSVTKPFIFPVPRLDDIYDALGAMKPTFFSSLDMNSGFWQIKLDEETAHKSAFITPTNVYQWKRLPFGLVNSPSSFSALLTHVLKGINWKICLAYIDDILVFSKTLKEHMEHLDLVFSRLQAAGLTLKPTKCFFVQKKIKYLGHVLSRDGVHVDPDKTSAVDSFPVPKTQKHVRSFIGLCSWFRRFIPNFSKIATPLNKLLNNDSKKSIVWTTECQKAFEKLKKLLVSPPILVFPDHSRTFTLSTDASGTALSYILGQRDDDNKEQVICYAGRTLNKHERNYSAVELECLAVVEGIKYYHTYLSGVNFKIYTDNMSLKYINSLKVNVTGRLARWSLLLQAYTFEIFHRKGKHNTVADALSRREYSDNKDQSEPEDAFPSTDHISSLSQQESPCEATFFYSNKEVHPPVCAINEPIKQESIISLQKKCPDFGPLYKFLVDGEIPTDRKNKDRIMSESQQYVILDHTLYHFYQPRCRGTCTKDQLIRQLAVPKCLRDDVLKSYHDSLAGGLHLGLDRTYRAIQLKYYWPKMYQVISDYIKSCDTCQRIKKPTHPAHAPLGTMPIENTFSRVHMDILGPLPPTKEGSYRYILVVIDSFSKWPEAFALKTQEAKEIAKVLYNEYFCRYGAPHTIVSDRGQNFMSKIVTAVCEIFQVTRHFTSSYHPMSNGVCESRNKIIAQSLRAFVDKDQSNWADFLSSIMMTLRMSPSTQTSDMSPYNLVFGTEMNLPFDTSLIPKQGLNRDAKAHVIQLMERLKVVKALATENLQNAQDKQKARYDKKSSIPSFKVGDLVLLHSSKVPVGLSPKMHHPWHGPYYIVSANSNHTYQIRLENNHKIMKSRIHANRLKEYHPPINRNNNIPAPVVDQANTQGSQNSQQIQPTPPQQSQINDSQNSQPQPNSQSQDNVNDNNPTPVRIPNSQQLYDIEKLVKYRYRNNKRQFQIKWKDYPERTWEPEENIPNELIKEFNINKTQSGKAKKKRNKRVCFKQ